jgi:hypothetical protein
VIPGRSLLRSLFTSSVLTGDTCTLTPPADSSGAQTWAGTPCTVICMKGNPSTGSGEDIAYDGVPVVRFWIPFGTTITAGYQLTFSGDCVSTYQVMGLPTLHADELLRPVDCFEIRTPREAV